jgi:hypothetical protein
MVTPVVVVRKVGPLTSANVTMATISGFMIAPVVDLNVVRATGRSVYKSGYARINQWTDSGRDRMVKSAKNSLFLAFLSKFDNRPTLP